MYYRSIMQTKAKNERLTIYTRPEQIGLLRTCLPSAAFAAGGGKYTHSEAKKNGEKNGKKT